MTESVLPRFAIALPPWVDVPGRLPLRGVSMVVGHSLVARSGGRSSLVVACVNGFRRSRVARDSSVLRRVAPHPPFGFSPRGVGAAYVDAFHQLLVT